ncbi:universal stress protein [Brevundimonas variabilis]|uniref:Nucleotide-binding universal stress UspA family protein n=1 Tax=Brevundimonas variabilis TaxID=74312 RepID=A0A7W9CLC7_9CAUL|nr:universal stress protein [Brevundimonas variabilis]MBB5747558.1 nucleotide-binding universal stress UspA family protein [Brevundimonas variabilis]
MRFASLLVYVDEGPEATARVALACAIAGLSKAHVIGLAASSPDTPPVDPYAGGAMLGEMLGLLRDISEADVARAQSLFWDAVGGYADHAEWRGDVGYPSDLVIQALRAADIAVLGRRDPAYSPARSPDPADVLLSSGRAVLIVPPRMPRGPIGAPAIVAWKDCREAQRAVASALPILAASSIVHVIEVCAADQAEEARLRVEDVAVFLGRHGIVASAQIVVGDGRPRCDQIIAFATGHGAGLIVAGGYGHARLREWVLGGVTHGLLDRSPICLLLSH